MKINLRKKKGRKDKINLYLDLYVNGKRHYEFLNLHLFQTPKTTKEREHNKSTELLAENIKAKRQLELQNDENGFVVNARKNVDFLEYFNSLTKQREKTGVNYDCWDSVGKHLERYVKAYYKDFQY